MDQRTNVASKFGNAAMQEFDVARPELWFSNMLLIADRQM